MKIYIAQNFFFDSLVVVVVGLDRSFHYFQLPGNKIDSLGELFIAALGLTNVYYVIKNIRFGRFVCS